MDWVKVLSEIESALGIRPVDIAKATGVTTSYISEIKKGKSKNPKSEFIQALISVLNVNPYWLFLGEGEVIDKDRKPQPQFDEIKILKEMTLFEAIQVLQKLEERDRNKEKDKDKEIP